MRRVKWLWPSGSIFDKHIIGRQERGSKACYMENEPLLLMKTWGCSSKLPLIHAMHSLYICLLTALLAFQDMLDIPQCVVWLGFILVVREYENNTSLMSEIVVHTVPGTSADKPQEHRKARAGKGKGRRKNAQAEPLVCFSVPLMALKERREVLHTKVKGISSLGLNVVWNRFPSWSLVLAVCVHALCGVHCL